MSGRRNRLAVATATCGLLLATAACAGSPSPDGERTGASAGAPSSQGAGEDDGGRLSGPLWRNPTGTGAPAVAQAQAETQPDRAAALQLLAEQPTATWFANASNPYDAVSAVSRAAADAGRLPVLVAYFVPGRDCGSYSAGGAPDADAYLRWIGSFAAALADRPAVVVLEPDAVAHAIAGCAGVDPEQRYELLGQAVDVLAQQPGVRTYLDAGNSGWITDLPVLAAALRASGVDRAAGIAVNVANFQTTGDSAEFGLAVSRQLEQEAPAGTAAARVVVDTSRNGAGPPPADAADAWCNPAGRRIGALPTTSTDLPRVDALLWVKQPGDSDGTCRGGPPAGQWWPPSATELVSPGP